MNKKKSKVRDIQSVLFVFIGFFLGVGVIWPGIVTETGRNCFIKIIKDGSDGNVSLSTIFSITPNYLMKIKNAQNKYIKVLLVGDFCFRKF
tara:strand:- start:344 stop:616 length:273 start_codon:yes stop_codon:yes gene_type:complete